MRNNLKALREARGWTQDFTAEAMRTTRSQLAKLEAGTRRLSDVWIDRAATAFGVDATEIISAGPRMVPIVGYVGAGAAAVLFSDGQGPFDEAEAPEGATDNTVAVEIRGESLGTLFDRWLVFYDDVRDPPGGRQIGKLCVCGLPDGRILVKKLNRGHLPGYFTLLSNVEPPIYDVAVDWAAVVTNMTPR